MKKCVRFFTLFLAVSALSVFAFSGCKDKTIVVDDATTTPAGTETATTEIINIEEAVFSGNAKGGAAKGFAAGTTNGAPTSFNFSSAGTGSAPSFNFSAASTNSGSSFSFNTGAATTNGASAPVNVKVVEDKAAAEKAAKDAAAKAEAEKKAAAEKAAKPAPEKKAEPKKTSSWNLKSDTLVGSFFFS
ncbi:MAG: hypothetical protein Q4G69_02015 [Planctomycetia bacterium]|nr:hypothetical protein [Planctomycetia bacterium]